MKLVKKIIVPRKDYIILDWLRIAGHTNGMPIEWFYKILFSAGKTEIEAGQFINQYVTKGILIKNYKIQGNIAVDCGINRTVEFDYDVSEK